MATEILTIKDLANFLQISESEIRKLISLNQIPYFEIGEENSKRKAKRFRMQDIEEFINKNIIKGDEIKNDKKKENNIKRDMGE